MTSRREVGGSACEGSGGRSSHSRAAPTSWKEEAYGIFGMNVESGVPLRIGLFFAVTNVILRSVILYFAYFLVNNDWLRRGCLETGGRAADSDSLPDNCTHACLLTHDGNHVISCGVMSAVNWLSFLLCVAMLAFDVYILLRLPVTNAKRLKWMKRQTKLSLAFWVCEMVCFLIFIILLILSVVVSLGFTANSVLSTHPHKQGLNSQLAVACFSMVSVFIYMFVDWCAVCDIPQFQGKPGKDKAKKS